MRSPGQWTTGVSVRVAIVASCTELSAPAVHRIAAQLKAATYASKMLRRIMAPGRTP